MEVITWVSAIGQIVCMTQKENDPYIFTDISVTEGSDANRQQAVLTDGQVTHDITIQGMTIKIDGNIFARGNKSMPSDMLYRYMQNTLSAAFSPKKFGTLYYQTKTGMKFVKARAVAIPTFTDKSKNCGEFSIDFEADSPYWYENTETNVTIGELTKNLSFPFSFPVMFGKYSKTSTVYNYSGFEIEPVIEIYSTSQQIVIKNETTGEFVQVDHAIGEGQKMVIDNHECTVHLYDNNGNLISDVSHWITLDSSFIHLVHGQNTISVSNEIAGDVPAAVMKWHTPLLGR